MLGVVGVGQAGGNIADEAMNQDIPSIAINYSERDLDSLENVIEKLHLVGSEGTGKVRENAQKLMKNNWELALDFVKTNMSAPSIEVIFVVFSTGGGSGSGISPILIEMLQSQMPDKTFVSCPILPDLSEVMVNQVNTLNALEELSELDILTLPIDNEKIKKIYGVIPKNRLYQTVNKKFIELITDLISYSGRQSKNGVIDQKDLLQLFNTNGIGLISDVKLANIADFSFDENSFTQKVKESWINSMFSQFEHDQVTRAGIVFDGDECLMELLHYDMLFSNFNNMPVDLFEGNYHDSHEGKVISMLTGLPWISERIELINQEIEHQKANFNFNNNTKQRPINKFKDLNLETRKKDKPKKSVSDILRKYQR